MHNVRVHIKEMPNGADGFASKGISLNENMMISEPLHHGMRFQSGLFNISDSLAAKEMAANHDEVLMHRSFRLVVHMEVLLKVAFFGQKGILSWIIHILIKEREKSNQRIMLDHLSEKLFDLSSGVECCGGLVGELKN